jgi:uncharacterized protein (TIGR01777 family)
MGELCGLFELLDLSSESMNIGITGGSGFIGSALCERLTAAGHRVVILDIRPPTRKIAGAEFIQADLMEGAVPSRILECDALIHLAGVPIFEKWTDEYKKIILESRVKTARALIDAVKKAGRGPRVFVSASAVGYYGEGGEATLTESSPAGTDFLARVCREWELVAKRSEQVGMRWVSVRTGIVLGPGGGMLSKLIPVFKWGVGGALGSGKQWFSWIHIEDLLSVYVAAVTDVRLSGPVNAVAPHPVRNTEFTRVLAEVLHRPAFFHVPGFALRMVLGELANAVLMSQRVVPKRLSEIDFSFRYPTIKQALRGSAVSRSR